MSAEIVSIADARRRARWEQERLAQIAKGRERLRRLFGDDEPPEPPRAA